MRNRFLKFLGMMALSLSLGTLLSVEVSAALCVSGPTANLRRGPGRGYPVTWEAIQYMPLKKLGKQGPWYRVQDVDGVIHWVREDLVTSKLKCAVVKNEYANLRKGPGSQFPLVSVGRADKYLAFQIMKEQNGYLEVRDLEGDSFWVKKDLVWMD